MRALERKQDDGNGREKGGGFQRVRDRSDRADGGMEPTRCYEAPPPKKGGVIDEARRAG